MKVVTFYNTKPSDPQPFWMGGLVSTPYISSSCPKLKNEVQKWTNDNVFNLCSCIRHTVNAPGKTMISLEFQVINEWNENMCKCQSDRQIFR